MARPLLTASLHGHGLIAMNYVSLATLLISPFALGVLLLLRCPTGAMANRAGRVLIAMPFTAQAGALVSLWVGSRLGLSPGASTAFALLVVSAVFAAMAASFRRRLFVVAATTLLATFASALWPARAFDIAALACGCACVEVALFFRALAREAPRELTVGAKPSTDRG